MIELRFSEIPRIGVDILVRVLKEDESRMPTHPLKTLQQTLI
jgi:hypothetical protein